MILIVKAQIGKSSPVRGRDAWALLELKANNDNGCTPIDHPGPRRSGYVHKLRKAGVVIETIREARGGAFSGQHARYCLAEPNHHPRKERRQVVTTIAGLQC